MDTERKRQIQRAVIAGLTTTAITVGGFLSQSDVQATSESDIPTPCPPTPTLHGDPPDTLLPLVRTAQ